MLHAASFTIRDSPLKLKMFHYKKMSAEGERRREREMAICLSITPILHVLQGRMQEGTGGFVPLDISTIILSFYLFSTISLGDALAFTINVSLSFRILLKHYAFMCRPIFYFNFHARVWRVS